MTTAFAPPRKPQPAARPPFSKAEAADANVMLADAPPQAVLHWAVRRFDRPLMATAFGAEGCCLLHMVAELPVRPRLINLDTGYQFAETLDVRERILARYGLAVEYVRPELSVAEYEAQHGGPLYLYEPDRCCHDRKVAPLREAAAGHDVWFSAVRRDQTDHRRAADVVAWDAKFGLWKVNPLLGWTKREVWGFILQHDVPYNALHDRGYPSVGCHPCTRAVLPGEDDRAGRWAGSAKKECGLHVAAEFEGGGGI